jgi:thiol-disulfide isomerase/thioredoxin
MNHLKASKIVYTRMFNDSRLTVFALAGGTATSCWHQDVGVRRIQAIGGSLHVYGDDGQLLVGSGDTKVIILDPKKPIQIKNSEDIDQLFILEETFRREQPTIHLQSVQQHLQVYKFEASWCGPCQALKPLWQQFTKDFPTVRFQTVDVDDDTTDLAQRFQVTSMPTFVLTDGSTELGRVLGANLPDLKTLLEAHL